MEKKLTNDTEIDVGMIDEDIVRKKIIKECADLWNSLGVKNIAKFVQHLINAKMEIHRLQSENERLTKKTEEAKFWENEYLEWATGFLKTRFYIKDWFTNPETQKTPCTYEFFASTLWEKIRPAMEWLDELKERNEALRKENAELQKQVDELKENQVIECHGMLKGCDMVKQAVKDTAKDLLIEFNEWTNEHYDQKYDAYCVHIPVDKVSEFLIQKLKEYSVEVE